MFDGSFIVVALADAGIDFSGLIDLRLDGSGIYVGSFVESAVKFGEFEFGILEGSLCILKIKFELDNSVGVRLNGVLHKVNGILMR